MVNLKERTSKMEKLICDFEEHYPDWDWLIRSGVPNSRSKYYCHLIHKDAVVTLGKGIRGEHAEGYGQSITEAWLNAETNLP